MGRKLYTSDSMSAEIEFNSNVFVLFHISADFPGIKDHDSLACWCQSNVGLVIVGPEDPLANGIVDCLTHYGIPCFGPTKQASVIESSKVFAKEFMLDHGIATAAAECTSCIDTAKKHIIRYFVSACIEVEILYL